METFGQRLRQAVESRGLRLDEVAEATGLGIEQIQALGRDDFGALPGDEIVGEALRSFAQLLDVDPDEVIADYLRERLRWLSELPAEDDVFEVLEDREDSAGEPPLRSAEQGFAVEPMSPQPVRTRRVAILGSGILALAFVAFMVWSRSSTAPESGRPATAREPAPMGHAAEVTPDLPDAGGAPVAPPADISSRAADSFEPGRADEQPADASGLSIGDHGVGRGVVGHKLVGGAGRFSEGERVWFWTRVEGGSAGESIEHVWFQEGEATLRVPLQLGGARWRTQSYKDLSPGSAGNWVVEAHDENGRVLARREFLCSPR